LQKEFKTKTIIFVGDRGMRIKYNIDNSEDLKTSGIQFITGLTKTEIKNLISSDILQLSLFSEDLAEVETEEGDRYVLSSNPDLEFSQRKWLEIQKDKIETILKEIKSSWNFRRLLNRDNELKIKNNETKNKNLKTKFTTKDIDRYKKQVNHALEQCKMQTYFSIENIKHKNFEVKLRIKKGVCDHITHTFFLEKRSSFRTFTLKEAEWAVRNLFVFKNKILGFSCVCYYFFVADFRLVLK